MPILRILASGRRRSSTTAFRCRGKKDSYMTLDEFFEHLGKVDTALAKFHGSKIRFSVGGGCYCPITIVCKKVKGYQISTSYYDRAAQAMRLNIEIANTIAHASDYKINEYQDLIYTRKRLLITLNLTEQM